MRKTPAKTDIIELAHNQPFLSRKENAGEKKDFSKRRRKDIIDGFKQKMRLINF